MTRHPARILAGALLLTTTGCVTHARDLRPIELGLTADMSLATGDEVGDPHGFGARLSLDWLTLMASYGTDVERRTTVPCGGFLPSPEPGEANPCIEQPVVQESEVIRGAVGYRYTRAWRGNRLLVLPYVGLTLLEHEERGMHTAARREGNGGGIQLGTTVALQRIVFAELWLGLSVDAMTMVMPELGECVDCYDPFRDGTSMLGVSLVASYRLP